MTRVFIRYLKRPDETWRGTGKQLDSARIASYEEVVYILPR